MRILQVVTLFSPRSAYGGPVRVALNQSAALRARNHEVVIAGAHSGYEYPPSEIGGTRVHLFPAGTALPGIGFAGLYARGMRTWLRGAISDFDIVHVHLARDFVTLPAARCALRQNVPLTVQTHGMIDPSDRWLARPLDRWWTRPVLRDAATVFHLTPSEAADLTAVAGDSLGLRELPNGVPAMDPPAVRTTRPEVLYLARLHPRKRPDMFIQMAERLIREGVDADFVLVGPEEGVSGRTYELVAATGLGNRLRYEGPVHPDRALQRIARASVYVLPSVDEPYPMSVLEAMSLGLPVVVTDSCGLAPLIEEAHSGRVVGPDLNSLVNAVRDLLTNQAEARAAGKSAAEAVRNLLNMDRIVDILEEAYCSASTARC